MHTAARQDRLASYIYVLGDVLSRSQQHVAHLILGVRESDTNMSIYTSEISLAYISFFSSNINITSYSTGCWVATAWSAERCVAVACSAGRWVATAYSVLLWMLTVCSAVRGMATASSGKC